MGMFYNVIDDSNIDNDMTQFISDMNDAYIFPLLPCILVYKVQSCDYVSMQPDVYPSPKLNPHQNLTLNWKDMNDISINRSYISS